MAKTYCYTKQAQCCVSEGFQGKMKNALQSQLQLKMFDALMCQFDEGRIGTNLKSYIKSFVFVEECFC